MSYMKNLQEFKDEMARNAFGAAPSDIPGHCIQCREGFSPSNVYSEAGWKETKISGLCERCFDEITKDIEEDFPEDEPSDGMTDAEADADTLKSAGMGTDEDYIGWEPGMDA